MTIADYAANHTSAPQPVLQALERATHMRTLSPQMLSGPYQGILLQMFSHMVRPRRVLEIGTFTGYAAICLAQGLTDDGQLHTIEVNDELGAITRQYVAEAGLSDKIILHHGDAALVIPLLDEVFDLVFLDAGKLDYAHHYELAMSKTRSGGFILADNVLWDNKVITDDREATTVALQAFNDMVQQDDRVENLLLPLRDGLLVIRKK